MIQLRCVSIDLQGGGHIDSDNFKYGRHGNE